MAVLQNGFPQLSELDLSENKLGNELSFLHTFKTIRKLSLESIKLTWQGVEVLIQGKFPYLIDLNLGNKLLKSKTQDWNEIGNEGIVFLQKLTTLEKLNLCSNKITDKGLQVLSDDTFLHLKSLNLSKDIIIKNKMQLEMRV